METKKRPPRRRKTRRQAMDDLLSELGLNKAQFAEASLQAMDGPTLSKYEQSLQNLGHPKDLQLEREKRRRAMDNI